MSGLQYDISSLGEVGPKILALLPEIAARAEETEQARRLPADLAAKLAEAGAFNLSKPASLGGLELEPLDFLKIVATVAEADASAGWCVMIAVTSTLGAAYMPEPAAREIFGADDVVTGGVFAPMGKAEDKGDYYLLSGQWQWGSGSANCSWLGGGAMIFKDGELQKFDNGAPYHRMLFFPAQQASLIDSWHVAGLKGTGSGDFSVEGIKVPKDRSVSFVGDRPRDPGALYKFPLFGLLALGVSAVALGNDGEISPKGRANLRLACAHATEISADICKTAYTLGGGSAVYSTSSLQRRFRDAHVATQHIATAPAVFELAGRTRTPISDSRF